MRRYSLLANVCNEYVREWPEHLKYDFLVFTEYSGIFVFVWPNYVQNN